MTFTKTLLPFLAMTTFVSAQPATPALQVLKPIVHTDAKGSVNTELQNASSQPITAYVVRWTVDALSTVTSQDFFPGLGFEEFFKASATNGIDALPPGGTITTRNTLANYPEQEVYVGAIAVIFADSYERDCRCRTSTGAFCRIFQ